MLTGKLPYTGENVYSVLRAKTSGLVVYGNGREEFYGNQEPMREGATAAVATDPFAAAPAAAAPAPAARRATRQPPAPSPR